MIVNILWACSCSKPKGTEQSNATQQTISVPSASDLERLATQRAVIEKHIGDEDTRTKYAKPAGKLGVLRALLEQKIFKPNQKYEIECMGVVLGDTFVQELGMEWVIVENEFGANPAVRLPDTSIIIYPLTMISKRIERGESVDVFDLFNGIADEIEQLKVKVDKVP